MKLCLRCNQYFNDTLEVCPKDQANLEPVGKDPLIGALIDDRYVIDSVIGKGSSGIVYKASRLMMGGEVAVKVIHSYLGADSASLDRLLRELKAAERLRHQHIITVWDSGTTDDGQPYLVMDYLEGITLSQLITQKGALPPKRVLNVIRQVVEALAHAHDQGLIHRDMKPENVVLEESEIRGDYVKVLDFGIADTPQESAARAKFNKPKTVAGSPAYMSPEQCQGFELDYRSDLYSLAVIVFEMFTGRRPFLAHDLMKLMYMTVTEQPPKMGAVRKDLTFPERVEAVVAKALSKTPDERQPTIRDFWKELEAACAGLEFGKSDRVKVVPREQQNVSDLEILPSERLIDEDKPKRPQFEAGPEDMPELFMPPPPPPRADSPNPAKPGAPGAPAPKPGGGMSGLVNKQQQQVQAKNTLPTNSSTENSAAPSAPPSTSSSGLPPAGSIAGGVKPLQPARVGPGGPKSAPGAPVKPGDAGRSAQKLPAAALPARPSAPPAPGHKPAGGPPPAPGAKPPGPSGAGPGQPKGAAPPPLPAAKPGMPQRPPVPPAGADVNKPIPPTGGPDNEILPDKTMNRLSALVKRPTSSMPMPTDFESKPDAPKPDSAKPAPVSEASQQVRPPSVYSYVPPKEEKPAESEKPTQSQEKSSGASQAVKAGAGAKPAGQAGPGGPGGAKTAGPGGAKVGPSGQKTGPAPLGQKPGAPAGAKAGPGGQKGGPGGQGAKPGAATPSGAGTAPGAKSGAGAAPATAAKTGAAPAASKTSTSAPTGDKAAQSQSSAAKPAPAKSADGGKRDLLAGPERSTPSKEPASTDNGDEMTPALARAGATWVDSDSLDGNLGEIPERRMSNLDWEDEIEALKTGSVAPIVLDGKEPLHPNPNQWPPGVTPQAVPPSPGFPNMQQSWPPGTMPGQPMMPPYDQSMSYPPGMMHPYMQPPGYPPPGYPVPPNQDVSGGYPMYPMPPMPQGQDVSGSYPLPGYVPGQPYPYSLPPGMMPGMPGMPPQGIPPQGMPPQAMPPGMMPPGMMPQNMPPGMMPGMAPGGPGQMPPFMSPTAPGGAPDGTLGRAIADDLRAEFGDSSTTIPSLGENLYEETYDDEPTSTVEEEKSSASSPEKTEEKKPESKKASEKKAEPASSTGGIAGLLGGDEIVTAGLDFQKDSSSEGDDVARERELAAKSAAEAEELGDSLLALMDATEKDRSGASFDSSTKSSEQFDKPKFDRRDDDEEKPIASGKGLGSLLGALASADDDDEPKRSESESGDAADGGNAFAAAVASSASVPSLTEKSKKEASGSAFGQLLAAVKDEEEPEAEVPSAPDDEPGKENTLPKEAIQQALEDLLPEPAPGSAQKVTEMKNPFAIDDDVLGTPGVQSEPAEKDEVSDKSDNAKKDDGLTGAARLAAAMTMDDDDEDAPSFGSDFSNSGVSGATTPSTSTSDALSRLLEAASKAPSKASDTGSGGALSDIDKMAARVNKPPAKVSRKLASVKSAEAEANPEPQPFGGFGGGGSTFGGGAGGAFGGSTPARTGTTGTNSSYSQDAVNARIAELNRKLEQQTSGRENVELPPAPPPDPSVIGDSVNRRDVVNRIMEEAAMRHQYGADYQPPPPQPMASKSATQSGSNFSASELDKVNSSRLASMAEAEQRRKKNARSRGTMPRFPVGPVIAVVLVVALGGAGFFFKDQISPMFSDMMGKMSAPPEKADDTSDMLKEVNDLIAKGKLNEARKILEAEEDAKGLPPELSEKLDVIYLGIAKYKKNNGATNDAIEALKLVPDDSSHYAEAQKLLKQYQKGGKKSSAKRKRR